MSAAEFGLWVEYLKHEPITPDAGLHMWAATMAATYNGPCIKRDKQLWRPEDFLPEPWPQPRPEQPAGQTAASALRHMLRHLRPRRQT